LDGLVDIIAVDWSGSAGSSRPIHLAHARDGVLLQVPDGMTRLQSIAFVTELASSSDGRLVVGFDFAFSTPAWFLRRNGLGTARQLWDLAGGEGERWLQECQPPFWGRRGTKRPRDGGEQMRITERTMRPIAGVTPKSVFQVGGAGTVGTGSIRGMPFLSQLQDAGFAIWPFDDPGLPLVLEIWPRLLTGAVRKRNEQARAAYVESLPTSSHLGERLVASEDAFDAGVSALVMSQHADEFERLAPETDTELRLEGRIWSPSPAPASLAAPHAPVFDDSQPAYSLRYSAALSYAAELHVRQLRKGTPIPYVSHLLAVSALVWQAGGSEDQAIAALLHDAVEDGHTTLEVIRSRFGREVAEIVDVSSDTDEIPKPPWRQRKEHHLARIESAPLESLVVVAADKVHNCQSIAADVRRQGPSVWSRFNGGREGSLWYYEAMYEVLSRRLPSSPLVEDLRAALSQLKALACGC
jgi:hypothetical protein